MITRVARLAIRYPLHVLGGWIVVIAVFGIIAIPVQSHLLPADLFIPGTQSYHWQQLEKPNYGLAIAAAIEGDPKEIDHYGPILSRALAQRPLTRVQSPWSPGAGAQAAKFLRQKPNIAVYAMDVRIPKGGNSSTVVPPLQRFIDQRIRGSHLRAYLSGDAPLGRELNNAGFEALHQGEIIAAPLLVLVLLIVFRSPVAAAIPLIIAGGTLAFGFGMLRIFTGFMELDIMALSLASMMGLALGIDYALLLVSRFREALDEGKPPRQAATLAANTAGRTALFAGCVLSALMLAVIIESPGSLLRSASIGAILVTVFAMASGITVCPAMLTLLGPRINMWQLGGRRNGRTSMISRVVRGVSRRPLVAFGLVLIPLLLLASPVLALKTTPPDPRQLPPGNPALVAYEQIRKAGLGPNVSIILRKPHGGAITSVRDLGAIDQLETELQRVPYVSGVAGPGLIYPRAKLITAAPAQIRQAQKEIKQAEGLLASKIAEVHSAQGQLGHDRQMLASGLANAQALLSRGQAELAGASSQIGQVGQLATGLGAAANGAGALERGTSTVQAGASTLASGLSRIHSAVNAAVPRILAADKQIRTAQSEFGELRIPAQIVQRELERANSDLAETTIGTADPAVARAKLDVAAALAADTGTSPVPGLSVPGYDGLANSLAQAEQQASAAGDQADSAVRQVEILDDALAQAADGAGRLVNPGLEAIKRGLAALQSGLSFAHQRVAAAVPQLRSLQQQTASLLATGQAQLQAAGAAAFPQMAQAQAQLLDAGNQLSQVRNALISRSGPFKPLREVDAIMHQSPFVFDSPYLIVAALQGTRPFQRYTVNTVVDSGTGGNVGQIVLLPNVPTNSPKQNLVVADVRALVANFAKRNHFVAAAGGSAAELVDYSDSMAARVPIIILTLCVITYLLLVPILRSLILPAIAVTLNVLTVTVAMGVVTAFSVNGILATPDPIGGAGKPDIVAVTAVFCIIFALSIDYYVFLLTRMREEYVRTQSNTQSVLFGIEKTGRIVTGAAAIMVGTFFAFTLTDFTIVKQLGIGLTSAIFIDATLVRLVLLPSVMRLFGDHTWWMPRWLDERLPLIDVEGSAFEHETAQIGAGSLRGAPGFA